MKTISSVKDIPDTDLVEGGSSLCAGCPADLGIKLAMKALGKEYIIVNASGCMTLFVTYPFMPVKVPWIHNAIENAASTAAGICAALKQLRRKDKVVCFVGDGATYDIGFQALSSAAERGDDFIYICYNNQSFGNTGVQMSSATPIGTYTRTTPSGIKSKAGNPYFRKPIVKIMASHGIPYAATACVSYPVDFMQKLQKAMEIQGLRFIDLLCPCPTGWVFDNSKTISVGEMAVLTGAWPLYEIENGRFRLTFDPGKLRPIADYLKMQRRFSHLRKEDTARIHDYVTREWALLKKGRYFEAKEF